MRPSPRLISVALAASVIISCSQVTEPVVSRAAQPEQFSLRVDTDSRAAWSFADQYVSGTNELAEAILSPTRIRGDGLGDYRGDECGVHAKIFWYDPSFSRSGDAVFDADMNSPGSCARRALNFYWTDDATATRLAPFMNARRVMQLGIGGSRLQDFSFDIGAATCARVQFSALNGRGVRVTRADVSVGTAPRSWRVESTADHSAECYVVKKGRYVASGELRFLPFVATIVELPYTP